MPAERHHARLDRRRGRLARCDPARVARPTSTPSARRRRARDDAGRARGARRVPAHRAGAAGRPRRRTPRRARAARSCSRCSRSREHPDASINDIAALTFTHQSSVSVVIQRLVRQRLVAKVPSSDDRRRHRLALTAKGRRLLDRAPVAVQEHLIAAIAALAATDRAVLARSLGEIARQSHAATIRRVHRCFSKRLPIGVARKR